MLIVPQAACRAEKGSLRMETAGPDGTVLYAGNGGHRIRNPYPGKPVHTSLPRRPGMQKEPSISAPGRAPLGTG